MDTLRKIELLKQTYSDPGELDQILANLHDGTEENVLPQQPMNLKKVLSLPQFHG